MGYVSAIGGYGMGLSQAEFAAQYQITVMKKQLDLMQEMGDLALQLIRSASVDPDIGTQLNIRV